MTKIETPEIPDFYGDLSNVSIQSIIKSRDVERIFADLKAGNLVMIFVVSSDDLTQEAQQTVTWNSSHRDGHNLSLIENLEDETRNDDSSLFQVLLMPNPRSYYEKCDQLKEDKKTDKTNDD